MSSLADVRRRIDALDRALVTSLKAREALVREAFVAKAGRPPVDPEREAEMMVARRAWATEEGLDSDRIEAFFKAVLAVTRPPT